MDPGAIVTFLGLGVVGRAMMFSTKKLAFRAKYLNVDGFTPIQKKCNGKLILD